MALALGAAVSTFAVAAVGGDDARLPAVAMAAAPPEVKRPGEVAKRAAARDRMRSARRDGDLIWPLGGAVTGRFGEPRGGRAHEGIDIPRPAGTPIRAAADGKVIMRETQAGYGRYTCVAHARITTCYAHQARFRTSLGDRVRRGEVIGFVGDSGSSTSEHLHFEVRRGTRAWGETADPARFLPRGRPELR